MATTTNYSWTTPDNTAYVKDGASAIRTLGSSVDTTLFTALGGAYPGLRLIKKQTIGTGVSTVNVTGAFSATYENYKIIISGGTGSNNTYIALQLGASTTGYSDKMIYGPWGNTSVLGAGNSNVSNFNYVGSVYSGQNIFLNCDLQSPGVAKYTYLTSLTSYQAISGAGSYGGVHAVATAYTDFTIIPTIGTMTGGTIYVYGYGIS